MALIFAHVSIFLCVVKKSGKIGQNQENRDKIKFGQHFPSKHKNCDRMHQITLHYKRNLQNIQIMFLFFAIIEIWEFAIFQGQSQKIVSHPLIFKIFQWNFLRSCTMSSCKKSRSFVAINIILAELFKRIYQGGQPPNQNRVNHSQNVPLWTTWTNIVHWYWCSERRDIGLVRSDLHPAASHSPSPIGQLESFKKLLRPKCQNDNALVGGGLKIGAFKLNTSALKADKRNPLNS